MIPARQGRPSQIQYRAPQDAVQALIEQGNVDPVILREITWALWDITPFYCPECRLNYCRLDWDMHFAVNPESHDCIIGTCPNGHRHLLG